MAHPRNQTVLITGASSGVGASSAMLFLDKGWNVVAVGRDMAKLEANLPASSRLLRSVADISRKDDVSRCVEQAIARFDAVDVLVNNAGYGITGPFEFLTDEQIRRHFDTAVFGHMNMMRELIPHMRRRRRGAIVNVTSEAGRIGFPYNSIYEAAKFGIEGFSESIRFELGLHGIRVKVVEPGQVKTDFSRNSDEARAPELRGAYKGFEKIEKLMRDPDAGVEPAKIAAVVYEAAVSTSGKLRYPASAISLTVLPFLPDVLVRTIMRRLMR
ncbi:NAD(P)-dependent dehydrogenase (short-subunit alcohol dehydrogenase family) [Methylobacterium brachiatum]|uniref:NAD(P)-dependent dehydrogenase (Short-subunit alcohol dehydrogenase family) n=1 Tax=Methylobacterium brachiatum TaxID=269660 RepID=A0AAJ1TKV6_9HYPH|nr:SDR family oxidoreductase [Methylobacterium brachiatum]MCB4802203.1 SDR family oxidoreductase [Methylobacterium brachiatum]MDQ0542546.1 NAD(P)-dependent dehydrogenase (short-subunit alcohol dehydrogenase family) [Methylobacterium brachiatum]